MPWTPTIGRVRWLLVVALLLGMLPLRAQWPDGQKRAAAYVALGLETFSSWNLEQREDDPFGAGDPFDTEDSSPPFPDPARLGGEIPASRFLEEGDELWQVTAILQRVKVLEASSTSWAIYNNTRQRLVLHGSRGEHGRMERLWQFAVEGSPRLIETRARLLKVPSRELEGVEWTAELVRERGSEELLALAATTRPGQRGSVSLKGAAADGSFEVEANIGADEEVIDLGIDYVARLKGDFAIRELQVRTAITMHSASPFYIEVGSENDEAHSLLIELRAGVQFMDGTLRRQWREFEDPRHELSATAPLEDREPKDLGNGFQLRTWLVPPTLLSDLDSGGGTDPDPFAAGPDELAGGRSREFPIVESPDGVVGVLSVDVLYEISDLMRETGIEVPDGGWVYFASTSSLVIAKLDAANLDLLDQLLDSGG